MWVSNYDDGRAYMLTWGVRVLSAHMRHRKGTRQQHQNHSTRHPHAQSDSIVLYSPRLVPQYTDQPSKGTVGGHTSRSL